MHPGPPDTHSTLQNIDVHCSNINFCVRCGVHGRALGRDAYADLFEVMGTAFGAPDASSFQLPDYRGRVLGAVGSGPGLTARALGSAVGHETRQLSVTHLPPHSHSGSTDAGGSHTHGVQDPGHAHTQTTINDDFNSSGTSPPGFAADSAGSRTWANINTSTTGVSVLAGGSHTHAFTTGQTGDGSAFGIMQPTLFGGSVFIYAGFPV